MNQESAILGKEKPLLSYPSSWSIELLWKSPKRRRCRWKIKVTKVHDKEKGLLSLSPPKKEELHEIDIRSTIKPQLLRKKESERWEESWKRGTACYLEQLFRSYVEQEVSCLLPRSQSLKHCFEEPKNQDEVFLGSHKNKALSSQSSLVVGKSKSCKVRNRKTKESRFPRSYPNKSLLLSWDLIFQWNYSQKSHSFLIGRKSKSWEGRKGLFIVVPRDLWRRAQRKWKIRYT